MIEIVFSESACGSLKMAQHYGKGDYIGGCVGVIISKSDGSQPTQEEISAAQSAAEEKGRLDWERATPMGGNPEDIFGFPLMLSVGDVSEDGFTEKRQKTIDGMWNIFPDISAEPQLKVIAALEDSLEAISRRVALGENIRIWYSNQPDERCGLYWFMTQLQKLEPLQGEVYVVKLPEYEVSDSDTMMSSISWGEISPGQWHRYTAYSKATTAVFRQSCTGVWRNLQKENAPLRAVINGKLHSVPETFYDCFICREIEMEKEEFREANVIGRILGKYQLGIGDTWISYRIEKMIQDGKLSVASPAAKGMPVYHRNLKKNSI